MKLIQRVFPTCIAVALFATSAFAQTNVAIVDVGAVFKGHPAFSQQLDALRQEAESFKANSIQLQQQLAQKAEILKQYTPGSAEFKAAETKLATESAALEVEQRNKMRGLMQSEAKLHYDTLAEVNQLISDYCDQRQIQMVLRFNGEPMNADNPRSIMQRVNGSIIYHRPDKDITPQIIAALVQQSGTASRNSGVKQR